MKKRILAICIAVAVTLCGLGFVLAAEPGSSDDPLISKSYLEDVFLPQIYAYIDNVISKVTPGQNAGDKFEVVDVKAGKQVIAGAGTEMILRMGKGSVIASSRGGLSDVTDGFDLGDDVSVPANHLLITPLGDGRGIQISNDGDAILMIKGSYEIK